MRSPCVLLTLALSACGADPDAPLRGPVTLVVLHSADTHSELFAYRERISPSDAWRGLGIAGRVESVGGFARLKTLVKVERARAERILQLDSGDAFQGSSSVDRFAGEAELRGLAALGVEAQALGNHELDRGAGPLVESYRELGVFPLLAANYLGDGASELGALAWPFAVLGAGGLRVGVIGVGNSSSVRALRERPNELGAVALEAAPAVQAAIDTLRPSVDVVLALTHLGLDADRALVAATSGLDAVFGGHQHFVLDEPAWVLDCTAEGPGNVRDAWGRLRRCIPRSVPIVHSGAYGKYLGRLELALDDAPGPSGGYDPLDRHEVRGAEFRLLAAHEGVPEDPELLALLEPYRPDETRRGFAGFAPQTLARQGVLGADSPLGNLAAGAVRLAAGAELSLVGQSSLRRDLVAGPVDLAALERSFPFDDDVVVTAVSGAVLAGAFEHAARVASARDCQTPLQLAGAVAELRCPCREASCAELFLGQSDLGCQSDADCAEIAGRCETGQGLRSCLLPVARDAVYSLATTEYFADPASGYFDGGALGSARVVAPGLGEAVATRLETAERCSRSEGCGEECERLPCVDARAGAVRDGRLRWVAP